MSYNKQYKEKIEYEFSVCKVETYDLVDINSEYCFTGKSDDEKSLVCLTKNVPANVIERNDGWKAFRIQGILDFSLIGILSKILTVLADNNIGVFVVSTFNTDYVLTKEKQFEQAIEQLIKAGYHII